MEQARSTLDSLDPEKLGHADAKAIAELRKSIDPAKAAAP
jgi:hypothetical protein